MTIHLTLTQVKEAVRKALREGRLAFQNPHVRIPKYGYDGNNFGCAIGVALTPEQIETIDRSGVYSLRGLLNEGIVTAPASEQDTLVELQRLHDEVFSSWAGDCIKSYRKFLIAIDWNEERDGEAPPL